MIYLDNNATTQVAPSVVEAMMPYLSVHYGNPSSAHALGRAARSAVDRSREQVATLLGASGSSEIVFTSGGTESDNWPIVAALGAAGHLITTAVEHEAVRFVADRLERGGTRVTRLAVDGEGLLDLDALRDALTEETKVVSIMHANNETGVLFPVARIAEIVKECSNALVHVDGVNAAGKVPIDLKNTMIDLYAVSGHKIHAPKGIGALYMRNGTDLSPLFAGGGQENGLRPGTSAVHQIVGLGAAAEFVSDMTGMDRVRALRNRMEDAVLAGIGHTRVNGSTDAPARLPNTSNISFENVSGEAIMAMLDEKGICVSTGSACASGSHSVSAVLQAMNVPYSFAMGSIRFSLGRFNTDDEVATLLAELPEIVRNLRERAGLVTAS